jgi:hypothetical protein
MLAQEWTTLLDTIAAEYPIVSRRDDSVTIGWPADKPEQTVTIQCLHIDGLMRILITADVCSAADVSERDALELAVKLLVGGIFIWEGYLGMRLVLTEGHYSLPLIRSTIEILRKNAIWFRGELLKHKVTAAATSVDAGRY